MPPLQKSSIKLQIAAKAGSAYVAFLRPRIARALRFMPTALRQVSIALVGDALMAKLHVQFMNVTGPTDVLTFELEHDACGQVTEGEIVICVNEARRQAREQGTRTEHELLLYAVHGLLHLNGYDDLTAADFRAIHREEDRILKLLGVGPVFEPPQRSAPRSGTPGRRKSAPLGSRKKDGRSR